MYKCIDTPLIGLIAHQHVQPLTEHATVLNVASCAYSTCDKKTVLALPGSAFLHFR